MLHKFRLLLIPVLATLFLAACDSETNGIASIEDSTMQEETTVVEEDNSEAIVSEESNESEETPVEEREETEESEEIETAEIAEEPVTKETEKTPAAETTIPVETEDLNPNTQEAVEQLLAETDIELENYVFFYTETEEYIEIEVRENIDTDATPLVGIYRYNLETDELLVNDYLTGEFIPFEHIQ